jgi:hypothetical protein
VGLVSAFGTQPDHDFEGFSGRQNKIERELASARIGFIVVTHGLRNIEDSPRGTNGLLDGGDEALPVLREHGRRSRTDLDRRPRGHAPMQGGGVPRGLDSIFDHQRGTPLQREPALHMGDLPRVNRAEVHHTTGRVTTDPQPAHRTKSIHVGHAVAEGRNTVRQMTQPEYPPALAVLFAIP